MVKGSEIDGIEVPEAVMETLNRTLGSLQQLETELPQFLALSDPDLLAQLSFLQRAHSLFSLAKLTSTLFSLKLRCRGINPNDHPVKSELLFKFRPLVICVVLCCLIYDFAFLFLQDKLNVLQKKLEPLRRLIEAQEQDIRNMNGEEGLEMNYEEQAGKKRKYPSSEEPSIQIDEMESLEKVKEEHLGYNSGNVKGIVIDISDDDEVLEP
ncbi:hypothetical protein V8G54_036008 [Vigna mungo]|uniref:Nuclear nucleic acid-binding protein C1D n=1 Tax=Vigna mungo TaxID=3915 RepID=A0AAQ3MHN1_VIGMU